MLTLPAVDERCEFCSKEVGVGVNCCARRWVKFMTAPVPVKAVEPEDEYPSIDWSVG